MQRARALPSQEIGVLVLLTALAAALRFATLGTQSFDFDEAYGAKWVLDGSLGHLFSQLPLTESSPPLHYLLAWLWSKLFGLGEVALRSLSALAGTALVPVTWAAGRELVSRRGALIAAALVALNPFLLWYGQEARTYALVSLLAGLSFWAFARALAEPSHRRLAAWAALSALALLSHYFAAFVVVPEAAWLLLSARGRRGPAIVAAAAVGVVGAALVPLALRQADIRTEWISGEPLGTRARGVVSKFLLGEIDPTTDAVLLAGALVLLGLLGWVVVRAPSTELRGAAVAGGVGAAAIALPGALDLVGLHYLLAKNVIAALPVLAVAAGGALGTAGAGSAGTIVAAALCAAWLGIGVAGALDPRLQRSDFRTAADDVASRFRPGVAIVSPYLGSAPLELYLPARQAAGSEQPTVGEILLVQALRRRDARGPGRMPIPPPPAGFVLSRRSNERTYTLVDYRAARPEPVGAATARQLVPAKPGREPVVLVR
jgi:mannosyltransferase